MANQHFNLDYRSPEQFLHEVDPGALQPGDRVKVRLEGGKTHYVFTYLNTVDGLLYGRSALNGHQVSVDPLYMTLTEKDG